MTETSTRPQQARQHELRGDLATACSLWQTCLKLDPNSYEYRLGYGRTLCLDEQYGAAREALLSALQANRDGAEALFFLARTELELDRVEDAKDHFRRAIALDPLLDHPQFRMRLLGGTEFGVALDQDERHPPPMPLTPLVAPPVHATTLRTPMSNLGELWGLNAVKERLRHEVIEPFAAVDGGLDSFLLFGPQDCAKQFIARCVAAELGATVLELECETLRSMQARETAEQDVRDFLASYAVGRPKLLTLLRLEKLFTTTQTYGRAERGLPAGLSFLRPIVNATGLLVCFHSDVPWLLSRSVMGSRWLRRGYFIPPPDAQARANIIDHAFGFTIPADSRSYIIDKTDGFTSGDLSEFTVRIQEYLIRQRDVDPEQLERYLEEDRTHAGPIDWASAPHVLAQIPPASVEWLQEARGKRFHLRFPELVACFDRLLPKARLRRGR